MRLVRAELLKLRRRWATYIVLGILLGLMALVYLLIGLLGGGPGSDAAGLVIRFPGAYGILNQFVFGLGSLLAVAYAAAIVGADWSYGVMRVFIARGESRARYVLAKAVGLAIILFLGILVAYATGMALTAVAAALLDTDMGQPFGERGREDLIASVAFGTFVVFQRAAIGFAVAMLLRSQLAGVVVGIVLYIAEPILSTILFALSLGGNLREGLTADGVQWYQFLPFSIGDSVMSAAASPPTGEGGPPFTPVPLEQALVAVGIYLVVSIVIAMLALRRSEIAG
jgi:ABC-type transport system involved in multi-copper enzyme maturation permease subunit